MQKYLYSAIMLLLLATACKNGATTGDAGQKTDTLKVDTAALNKAPEVRYWVIKDSGMYSKKFLEDLYNYKDDSGHTVSLIDNYIVLKNDTSYFPDYFLTSKQWTFEGKNDSEECKLMVFNSTYTSVLFSFSVIRKGKPGQRFTGKAELSPMFFLASGANEDDADSTGFGVTEYNGESDKYNFTISVGSKDKALLAKFTSFAKDSIMDRSYSGCPTLRCSVPYVAKRK